MGRVKSLNHSFDHTADVIVWTNSMRRIIFEGLKVVLTLSTLTELLIPFKLPVTFVRRS